MTYRIQAPSTRLKRELRRIPKRDLDRIGTSVQALATEPIPHGAIQLEKDVYRIRIGSYRVIYKIFEDEKLILIGRIARRSEKTYQRLSDLFD